MRTSATSVTVLVVATLSQLMGCAASGGAGRSTIGKDAVQREQIEWCDIWVTNADKDDLPRVLLIGDSITRGYFSGVEKHLAGKANCARVTTSKCIGDPGLLQEIEPLLTQYQFQVIHVNNGLHGVSYTDEQYARQFAPFMETLMKKAPGASVIWAATTPLVVNGSTANERTERVKVRNRTAAAFAAQHQIPVDDLFGLVVDHPEYFSGDGVHLNKTGIEVQARQVADCILRALQDGGGR
jgi:hypothetical protein